MPKAASRLARGVVEGANQLNGVLRAGGANRLRKTHRSCRGEQRQDQHRQHDFDEGEGGARKARRHEGTEARGEMHSLCARSTHFFTASFVSTSLLVMSASAPVPPSRPSAP